MTSVEPRGISVEELASALRSVDPRAVLVPPRILRRVLRGVLGIDRLMGHVPHRGGFAAATGRVLEHAQPEELGLSDAGPFPNRLILLAEPDLERIEDMPRRDVLLRYWRSLFHARVHLALDERSDADPAGRAWLDDRINRLGRLELAEARSVLVEDSYLTLPADDRATYVEFAAVFLELNAFHPEILPHTFPAIADHEAVLAMLATDVDPDALLDATRPPGAPAPDEPGPAEPAEAEREVPEVSAPAEASPRRARRLRKAAQAASARGNNVRSAILHARAARLMRGGDRSREQAAARAELEALARRLHAVVGDEPVAAAAWRRSLVAFLDGAARRLWSREARMLYDLQTACLDRERPISAVDLVGWITSAGRRPIRRPMPDQHEVMILKHLRSAERRIHAIRGPEPARGELDRLIAAAIARQARAIRERFRPRIGEILDRVGLRPRNAPERAAARKLVEELLDLIVARGFLRIGDLRDAISRNAIKLPDLAGPVETQRGGPPLADEDPLARPKPKDTGGLAAFLRGSDAFFRGDPLLRADDALSRTLDGVYHRGEVYLRALQRASSLAFGTKVGRWLSLFVALPFGAAFVALEGLQHIVGPIVHKTTGAHVHLYRPESHLALGLLLLGLINFRRFRAGFGRAWRAVGRGLKAVFLDAPAWVLDRAAVRWVVNSRSFLFLWNWFVKPALLTGLVYLAVAGLVPEPWSQERFFGLDPDVCLSLVGSTWFLLSILANSRSGRVFEEIAADGASRLGQRLWRDLLPNIFHGVMDGFAAILEGLERILYGVDEWLRFRGGDGRAALAVKAVLGLAWAVVAYVARIYVNLLIEPQINPIKHFPVVTVSHKIILPMSVTLIHLVRTPLLPVLGKGLATTFATTTVFLLPGVFGFLVWELKENWRLYAANRPTSLKPVPFGHHGETMVRLLRRGFHSGTLPKLFARLRKADRAAERGRGEGPAHKRAEQVHHIEEQVLRFVDRGVISVLAEGQAAGQHWPSVGLVECSTNRVVVELRDCGEESPSARVAFEELNRQLRLRLVDAGWLAGLDGEARRALASALAGLCAMSGADLVVEPGTGAELDARGLVPAWSAWVASWEADAEGRGHRPVVVDAERLLPTPGVTEPSTRR